MEINYIMKICWNTLENVRLTYNGLFLKKTTTYHYGESCLECGDPFLYVKRKNDKYSGKFCSRSCAVRGERSRFYGLKGKLHPGQRLPGINKGKYGPLSTNWKGGVVVLNQALYDTYGKKLSKYQKVRRYSKDRGLFEVTCKYCGKWFLPTMSAVEMRLRCIEKLNGESNLYCSEECKPKCRLYGQNPEHLMLYDKQYTGDVLFEIRDISMQQEFRRALINRSGGNCEICGRCSDKMVAHHITPVKTCNDILAWDLDNGLYLCSECERRAHSQKGCTYIDIANN